MSYKVENALGTKSFIREEDAYDYAIMLMRQVGIKSEISEDSEDIS